MFLNWYTWNLIILGISFFLVARGLLDVSSEYTPNQVLWVFGVLIDNIICRYIIISFEFVCIFLQYIRFVVR